jgi:hypothetical protein
VRAEKAKNKQVDFRHFSLRSQQTRVNEGAYVVEKEDAKKKEVNENNVKSEE